MNNKKLLISILSLIVIGSLVFVYFKFFNKEPVNNTSNDPGEVIVNNNNFNSKIIKEVDKINTSKKNYLVSPYSIEIALNLLKESTNNKTKEEIVNLLPNREIAIVNSDKVRVSNATFIKNKYKDYVLETFINNLKNKYNADVIYDDFNTPKPINDWVNEKTDKMIPELIDKIDPNFIFGVVNAVALDLEFKNQFECVNTYKARFTKNDGLHIDVYMMNQTYDNSDATYVKKDDYEAISIPYKTDNDNHYAFEFIGIKVDDIDTFINNLDDNKIKNIMNDGIVANSKDNIKVNIPKFSYSYDLLTKDFSKVLKNLGIKDLFGATPDFTNFISADNIKKLDMEPALSEAIHKTYIDFNEKGTRAAAVTGFLTYDKSSLVEEHNTYTITFDKPFIYLIREKTTGELLFFGTVYEPTKWNGNTCQMID